jgi:hypothetical protein
MHEPAHPPLCPKAGIRDFLAGSPKALHVGDSMRRIDRETVIFLYCYGRA